MAIAEDAPREFQFVNVCCPASVLAIYEGKIPSWWLPDAVVVVDELPHTATGKVHKLTLRARFRDHLKL